MIAPSRENRVFSTNVVGIQFFSFLLIECHAQVRRFYSFFSAVFMDMDWNQQEIPREAAHST